MKMDDSGVPLLLENPHIWLYLVIIDHSPIAHQGTGTRGDSINTALGLRAHMRRDPTGLKQGENSCWMSTCWVLFPGLTSGTSEERGQKMVLN